MVVRVELEASKVALAERGVGDKAPRVLALSVGDVLEAPDSDGGGGELRRLERSGERRRDDEKRVGVDVGTELVFPAEAGGGVCVCL